VDPDGGRFRAAASGAQERWIGGKSRQRGGDHESPAHKIQFEKPFDERGI